MVLVHFLSWAFVEYQENNHFKMETLATVISEGRMVILLYENATHLMHIHKNLKSLQHRTYNVITLLRQRTLICLLRAFFPLFSTNFFLMSKCSKFFLSLWKCNWETSQDCHPHWFTNERGIRCHGEMIWEWFDLLYCQML